MARRRGTKGKAKRYPAQRFLYFDLSHTGSGEDNHYIDLAACLSAINGRLYRQGRMYHVANATIHDTNGNAKQVKLSTIADTYTARTGWHMMFDAWKDQRARTLENSSGEITGKWADFKVLMNSDMKGDADWCIPVNSDRLEIRQTKNGGTDSEWMYSVIEYTDADGTPHSAQALGMYGLTSQSANYVSLTNEYQNAVAQTQVETPTLGNLTNSVILGMNPLNSGAIPQEILANIADDNDVPPYSASFPIGGGKNPTGGTAPQHEAPFPVREMGITSTSVTTQTVGGFPVPLGLLQVETQADANNTIGLLLELVPGSYKGVHAEAF